jgi:hypothetical protein
MFFFYFLQNMDFITFSPAKRINPLQLLLDFLVKLFCEQERALISVNNASIGTTLFITFSFNN